MNMLLSHFYIYEFVRTLLEKKSTTNKIKVEKEKKVA